MLSDAALYRAAGHPDKARLVFNAALQQELRGVARHREVSCVPLATGPTITSNGAVRPSKPVLPQNAGKSTDPGGWDVDRKMKALTDLQLLLRRPYFFYLDFGAFTKGGSASGANGNSSFSKDLKLQFSFQKILPLFAGQIALLDLWEYLLDMCDLVPVRNRCRALYLRCAAYILRRLEFIDGYPLDGQQVRLEDEIAKRYYKLLERSIRYCSIKMHKARLLADEHRFFVAHVYVAVFFRFPDATKPILDAIIDCTETLEDVAQSANPKPDKTSARRMPKRRRRPSQVPVGACRSPRSHRRDWNAVSDNTPAKERLSTIDLQLEVFSAFSTYKEQRNTARVAMNKSMPHIPDDMVKRGSKAIEVALEAVFQEGISHASKEQELAFIHALPLLYAGDKVQRQAYKRFRFSHEVLESGLSIFEDRLRTLGRDDLLAVSFVAALLSDVATWCNHRFPDSRIMWHCVPGYFCMVRLFVAVFQRMCQRRVRTGSTLPTVDRILSIIDGETADPWVDYWNEHEKDIVVDAAGSILKNEPVMNVLIQIILEGTNITDPTSVNYSFGILQRILEVGAAAALPGADRMEAAVTNGANSPTARRYPLRRLVGDSLDADYFLGAMRTALQSSHVQILLKVLTCLYNCIGLLPTTTRKRLVAELLLRDNFFRFFLHWNEEIRKIFCYVIVFKTAISNRLDLPCTSDRILLAHSPYFEKGSSEAAPSGSASYFSQLSEMAQSIIRNNGASEIDAKKKKAIGKNALQRLIVWDPSAQLRRPRTGGTDAVFRDSLGDEELSVDLLIASKLDALFKMTAEQLNPAKVPSNGKHLGGRYFPGELEAYAEQSLMQYVLVLCEYYDAAFKFPAETPVAPSLEFTISLPFFTD